jgi:hypothetical protein
LFNPDILSDVRILEMYPLTSAEDANSALDFKVSLDRQVFGFL